MALIAFTPNFGNYNLVVYPHTVDKLWKQSLVNHCRGLERVPSLPCST